MKQYLVFYGYNYYPHAGMEDFIGDFDSLEEAKSVLIAKAREYTGAEDADIERMFGNNSVWGIVWDSITRQSVLKYE